MMEMSDNEEVRIEMHGNNPVDPNIVVVQEWYGCINGGEVTKRYNRERRIERVPPLLKEGEKGRRNQEYYEPAVVSLGPYHHNQPKLAQAEKYKRITLEEFRMGCGKTMGHLYNKVFEVVQDARKCYIDGSTDGYNDEEFSRMMLRDACFVLFFIECISCKNIKFLLNNEYLGALGFANITRDIFVLENQIPFVVMEVLLELRFQSDKGEDVLNGFFNYLNYGEVKINRDEKVLENEQPLHLLELYRSYFISLPASIGHGSTGSTGFTLWGTRNKQTKLAEDYNYVKRNRSLPSVMELKAKGIFLKRTYESSNEDINFVSHCCWSELELMRRAVSVNTKAIYLNMIAYEMCAHNPNDFRTSTYVRVMKSLVIHCDDVKELKNNNILLHSLGRDEDVVKMFDEIEVPAVNLFMFSLLRQEIEKHSRSKYKAAAAELINIYFSSPWKTVALLVASAILFTSFLQTYFAIRPLPDDSNADVMKLLTKCMRLKPPTKPT